MKFNILPVVSTLGENLPAERSLSRRRPVVASFRVPDLLPNEPGKCGGLRATGRRGRRRESLFSLPKGAGHAGGRGCRLPKTKRANERRLDTFTNFPVPLFSADIQFQTFGVEATAVRDTAPRGAGRGMCVRVHPGNANLAGSNWKMSFTAQKFVAKSGRCIDSPTEQNALNM